MSKIFNKDLSAAANETAINNKFAELEQGGGGGTAESIVLASEPEIVDVPFQLSTGYFDIGNKKAVISSYHNLSQSASSYISDAITITNASGKYIFVPFGIQGSSHARGWMKYSSAPTIPSGIGVGDSYEEDTDEGAIFWNMDYWHLPYMVLPIKEAAVTYRFMFWKSAAATAKVYVATKEWLQRNRYINNWAGKTWLMYGDSYLAAPAAQRWHEIYAQMNCIDYINKGQGGIGLVKSPSLAETLLNQLETRLLDNGEPLDVDIIGLTFGRNDYSAKVPIGTIDDMWNPPDNDHQYPWGDITFMGGLNYICNWLIDNYLGKKVFFITPWYFLDDQPAEDRPKPVEYIDAILAVTGKWGLPCFDAARQSGISIQNRGFRIAYTGAENDTSHLNFEGHKLMAKGPVAKWLENLFIL